MPAPLQLSKKTRFSKGLAAQNTNYEGRNVAEFVKFKALVDRFVTGTETLTLL
jgi:hypothetical protein